MKELIIVGAGGLGREVLQWVKDINRVDQKWAIKGFIDDNLAALDNIPCSHNVIGSIKDWQPSPNEVFVCAIAAPSIKEKLTTALKSRGFTFETIIHPTASISEFTQIGEGTVVYPFAAVNPNASVGAFVTLLSSGVGHDASVGDFCTISSCCDITGGVKIGKRVFLGSHATIVPHRSIGDDVFIGAGSVVMTDIKASDRVMGNPARRIPVPMSK